MGRGRDSPNNNESLEEFIRGKTFEFPTVSKSLSKKEFNFTIKDPKNLRFRFSNPSDFPVNDVCLVKKDEYLIENGAYLFKELVKSTHGKNNPFRIFSLKELQKATNNFSANLTLSDSFPSTGTYRGTIEDRHVAVRIPWFRHALLNEVVSLSLIKHRNVVKLLGCCLETKKLILVHELPPNGVLKQYILYEEPPPVELLWTDRLRIATEIADAVAYLHSELNITHGRLWWKSAVLLDEFHSAKLGAFDHSKIQKQAESSDVETDIRNKLRKRDDVYDFGKILLNLLGIDYGKVEHSEILKYLKLNVSEKEMPQIDAYIDLFLRCRDREDDLSMKEVVRELRHIRSMMNHQPTTDGKESDNLSSGAN